MSSETLLPGLETLSSTLKVLFIHGGGWGVSRNLAEQPFAKYLQMHFCNTHIENMTNTSEFEQCIRQQTKAIIDFRPHLIVCKSQGGPTLLQLLHRGIWRGPSVLCCPAIVPGIDDVKLADDVSYRIVSGSKDVAVPLYLIDHIMQSNEKLVDNGTVSKCIVDDDHGLNILLDDDQCPENNLYLQIEHCWRTYLNIDQAQRRSVDSFAATNHPQYTKEAASNTDWFRPSTAKSPSNKASTSGSCGSCSCYIL